MLFKAIFSTAWENIDQNFYTRLAQTIDPIDSAITFYAEILSSGILKSLDKEGNDVTDKDALIALLKNPNDNQNFQEFIKEWIYYHFAHGWNYVVPQSSSIGFEKKLDGTTKTQLYNCDPDHFTWGSNSSFFGLIKNNKITFSYKPLDLVNIDYKDIIPYIDVRQNPEKPHMGISRLLALRKQIENYSLALQGDENLIKRSGSILVSLDSTKNEDMGLDSVVGTGQFDNEGNPITTTQKEQLERQLKETGLGNNSMGIMYSSLPLKSQPLSAGLESIKFDEKMVGYARQMYNKLNVPKEFQNLTTEAAKFANRQMAMMEVIQNTIEPLGASFCDKMKTYFKWENTISLEFSHLPVFADNEETKLTTQQALVTMYEGLFEKGRITDKELIQIYKDNGII